MPKIARGCLAAMGEHGFDDPDFGFLEFDEDAWVQPPEDPQQVELDMWADMLGPGETYAADPEDDDWKEPPTFDGDQPATLSATGSSTPQSSPARRPLQRHSSQESARSSSSLAGVKVDPYFIQPQPPTGSSSSSSVALPTLDMTPVQTPRPRATESTSIDVTPPPPKRLRIIGKTSPQEVAMRTAAPFQLSKVEIMEKVKEHTGFLKLRDFYVQYMRPALRAQKPELKSQEVLELARQEWAQKSGDQRLSWAQEALNKNYKCCPKAPSAQHERRQRERAEHEEQHAIAQDVGIDGHSWRFRGALGTWNGEWLKNKAEWAGLLAQQLPEDLFLQAARKTSCLAELAAGFQKFLEARCHKLGLHKWSFQIEASLKSADDGRIHIHAFFHSLDKRVHCGTKEAWSFGGAMPHLKHCQGRGQSVEKLLNRGHFYCQCDKQGHLVRFSNYVKHVDFAVEQKWVIALWQLRKLTHSAAKHEIIMARGRTNSYLQEINKVEQLEEKMLLEQEKAEVDRQLAGSMRPFKIILDVELWKLQYEKDLTIGAWGSEPRFKFLVLTGPSCDGKTQFAKGLWGLTSTLLVQCQNVTAPCLTQFNRLTHKAVVFDECTSNTIVKNKALFQANSDGVLLGQSQCNEHAYWRFLYGVPMIICCNDWLVGITPGSEEEKWLLANSIVYDVKFQLWVKDESEERIQEIET